MPLTRLNKLLSQAGAASRRLADDLIAQGRVEVNGAVVAELGAKADPAVDDIRVDGRRLRLDAERRYLLMNKPRGVLSTRSDPRKRTTVIDVLTSAGIKGYFYPVGRLDYDSEGLILLTNDGDFAERVMHPRYELERTYEALVVGVPDERDLDRLRRGLVIDGRKTLPAAVQLVRVTEGRDGAQSVLELTLREGRNRQVRHMCSAIAHPVDRLKRIRIGGLNDRNLRPGQIRDLSAAEVKALMARPARSGRPAKIERADRKRPHQTRPQGDRTRRASIAPPRTGGAPGAAPPRAAGAGNQSAGKPARLKQRSAPHDARSRQKGAAGSRPRPGRPAGGRPPGRRR